VTLKFIGEPAESSVDQIKQALASTEGRSTQVVFRGYGFFPTAKSARVFWIGMEAGPELAAVAAAVDAKLTPLGIAKEERKFTPHLTLARSSGGSGAPGRQKEDGPRSKSSPAEMLCIAATSILRECNTVLW